MQRVKTPGGCVTAEQLRGLAHIARQYTPEYPLHLTRRQAIELHGVRPDELPAVQAGIHVLGLTSVGACGDALRNITLPPENGFLANSWDVGELALRIQEHAQSLDFIHDLPRKFKISISGSISSTNRPWVNDLGINTNDDGTLRVVAAGSLGARPQPGILLYESLEFHKILSLIVAVLRLFHLEGDRENRRKARLRHIRERLGDRSFSQRVDVLLNEETAKQAEDVYLSLPALKRVTGETPLQKRLAPPLGDLMPEEALALADAAANGSAAIRLGLNHDLFLYGNHEIDLPAMLQSMVSKNILVACPGTTWCSRGIADSRRLANRISEAGIAKSLSVAISGCPNNCAHSAVADIGLIGRKRRVGGRPIECFRFLAGGGNGQDDRLAQEFHRGMSPKEVLQGIEHLDTAYQKAGGIEAMRFEDFVKQHEASLEKMFSSSFGDVP
jgi:sulfite reductase beta subunit-like hemoprotein